MTDKRTDTAHRSSGMEYGVYLLSFLISAVGLLLIFKSVGFYPFKDKSLFAMDMKDQYVEFYASLRYLFTGENSLFFSWSRSMGGSFYGVFAYYLASPLNLLMLFFPLEKMPLAVFVLSVLKISLCGLSFSLFGTYLWKRRQTTAPWIIVPFAVSYALMSYNLAYLMCLMWMDAVILLPIVILGLEKLLDGQRGTVYLLSLTLALVTNYYMGYMVGLFGGIYFLFRFCCDVEGRKRGGGRCLLVRVFGLTLGAVGLAAPILVPVIWELRERLAAGAQSLGSIAGHNPVSLKILLGQLRNGAYQQLNNTGFPLLYCGYIGAVAALVFFWQKSIGRREKLGAVLVLSFFSLSFYLTPLDRVWHGFVKPNFFPYRYSFLCSFFLLYLALRCVCALPWELYCRNLEKILRVSGIEKWMYPVTVVLLLGLASVDLGTNGRYIFRLIDDQYLYASVEDYTQYLASTRPLIEEIKERDGGLYRVNETYEFSKNDALLLGFNGMAHYSSAYNRQVNQQTHRLGFAQIHFWNTGYGSTPLTDSLFGIRYILTEQKVGSVYELLYQEGTGTDYGTLYYENPYALSFAFAGYAGSAAEQANPFFVQNSLLNLIAGKKEAYFTEYPVQWQQLEQGWQYTFTTQAAGPVYLYIETSEYSYREKTVLVNGQEVGSYFTDDTTCPLYLGTFVPGEVVTVTIPKQKQEPKSVCIAALNTALLYETIEELRQNELHVETHHGGFVSGQIQVPEGKKIVTTIPASGDWKILVDGKPVQTETLWDTFLVIPASPGNHEVVFQYVPGGVREGFWVCLGTAVLLLLTAFRSAKSNGVSLGSRPILDFVNALNA